MNFDKVKNIYQEAYKKYGNNLSSILIPKGRQNERFQSITSFYGKKKASLLDYGCGLGHLSDFLEKNFIKIDYNGCDIVEEFIVQSKKNYPNKNFFHIADFADVRNDYDYIAAVGVFNLMYDSNPEKHRKYVFGCLEHLFKHTKRILSVNFMSEYVDFKQPNAYHQDIAGLLHFCVKNLSRRFFIDQTYMPYEFTIHIFKDDRIVRPDNVFNPHNW